MPDTSHLVALQIGLAHERARLASARSEPERASRAVWVAQREREIAGEFAFLGMDSAPRRIPRQVKGIAMRNPISFSRDRTRRADAKRCALARRADRRAKSARLFLAFAFGPDAGELSLA